MTKLLGLIVVVGAMIAFPPLFFIVLFIFGLALLDN